MTGMLPDLVDDDIPMNEGVMKPLEVVLPAGTMLSPRYPAAVIAVAMISGTS